MTKEIHVTNPGYFVPSKLDPTHCHWCSELRTEHSFHRPFKNNQPRCNKKHSGHYLQSVIRASNSICLECGEHKHNHTGTHLSCPTK